MLDISILQSFLFCDRLLFFSILRVCYSHSVFLQFLHSMFAVLFLQLFCVQDSKYKNKPEWRFWENLSQRVSDWLIQGSGVWYRTYRFEYTRRHRNWFGKMVEDCTWGISGGWMTNSDHSGFQWGQILWYSGSRWSQSSKYLRRT